MPHQRRQCAGGHPGQKDALVGICGGFGALLLPSARQCNASLAFGHAVNPHLFRDCAATTIANAMISRLAHLVPVAFRGFSESNKFQVCRPASSTLGPVSYSAIRSG
jgi:hypothetical protein